MVFIHYAEEHPLYTYAFYSPRTKRVLFRQDCIFLPAVFPMRAARHAAGLSPNGEETVPVRSPLCEGGLWIHLTRFATGVFQIPCPHTRIM